MNMIKESEKKGIYIYENRQEFFIKEETAVGYLDQMCRNNGSTLTGRKDAICERLSITQKPPILISEKESELMFSLYGFKSKENIWISYRNLKNFKKIDEDCTRLYFSDGEITDVMVNIRVIKKQMERCKEYLSSLK